MAGPETCGVHVADEVDIIEVERQLEEAEVVGTITTSAVAAGVVVTMTGANDRAMILTDLLVEYAKWTLGTLLVVTGKLY